MEPIAIIGGSGFDQFTEFADTEEIAFNTPYGEHASGVKKGFLNGIPCIFIPRHGTEHECPPHKVNYRANIWLLKSLEVKHIIAINVVGGITTPMSPSTLVIPHQIIDYTYGREQTFFDGIQYESPTFTSKRVDHIDFSQPYNMVLRDKLIAFLDHKKLTYHKDAVYGCTQGPRLETNAEIKRLLNDGCDIVGMTAMPEAALAKELSMAYCSLCLVVNWAAGIKSDELSIDEIMRTCHSGINEIKIWLPALCDFLIKNNK